jgi:PqqD family protein of HPr-rel-A system
VLGAPRWRLADVNLSWRSWPGEDESVIFSPASGDVHVLNDAARQLIESAAQTPRSLDQFIAVLSPQSAAPADELVSSVQATIEMLDAAGILEPDA